MLYLARNTDSQTVMIPRVTEGDATATTFQVRNTVDLDTQDITFTNVSVSDNFYTVTVTLPEGITPGEYEYKFMDVSSVLSTGLLVIRDDTFKDQYFNDSTYEQYRTD